jgi:hypothetical protein
MVCYAAFQPLAKNTLLKWLKKRAIKIIISRPSMIAHAVNEDGILFAFRVPTLKIGMKGNGEFYIIGCRRYCSAITGRKDSPVS